VGSIPSEAIEIFNLPNLSSSAIAMEFTQPTTEASTKNYPMGKERPARKAVNLIAICKPIV
jgi:hypothetical protein